MANPMKVLAFQPFSGLANYYSKFIKDYSHIVILLIELLKKDQKWICSKDCHEAFNRLQFGIVLEAILRPVNFESCLKYAPMCQSTQ